MANRNYNRKQALEKEVKEIYLEASIGAAGAPTLVRGLGVTSITRTGTGDYTIQLQDKYNRLMCASISVEYPSPQTLFSRVDHESVAIDGKIYIGFGTTGDSSRELTNGSVLKIRFDLKNSSV